MKNNRTVLVSLLLALVVWGVYGWNLDNPFEFDDWHVIPQNPGVRGPSDIPEFFVDVSKFSILEGNRDYRPLFLTSMALSWWVGGGSTVPFHMVSVMLHMGNVLLLFLILRRFFVPGTRVGEGPLGSKPEWIAGLAAALFAVHPLTSEAVLYISSQSVPMAAFFSLLAFFLFLSAYSGMRERGRLQKWLLCSGSYLSYFLALLSKPTAITLPLVLLAWQWFLVSQRERESWRVRLGWARLRKHIPYAVVTVAFLALRSSVAGNPVRATVAAKKSFFDLVLHFLTQTKALVLYYLKLAIAPIGQSVDIEYPRVTSVLDGRALLALLLAGVVTWCLIRFRRERKIVFWSLWFPICLLVTTYLIALGQTVREARVYLSLAGFCVVVALLVAKGWDRLPIEFSDTRIGARSGRFALGTAIAVVLVVFSVTTWARSEVWSSGLTLWGEAARNGGTWRAHMNYGLALEDADRPDEAMVEFKKALELGPYAWSHLNLGLAYLRRSEIDTGLAHLRTAVELWPTSPETHYYLGRGLAGAGDVAGAEKEYRSAIELRDNYVLARNNLAGLYESQGRRDEALAELKVLAQLEPAREGYRDRIRALEQDPGQLAVRALFERAWEAQRAGNRDECIPIYEKLLELAPRHRQGTFNLAYALRDGKSAEEWARSAELFERVLEIDPSYSEAIYHLATVSWRLERTEEAIRNDRLYLELGEHEELKAGSRRRLAEAGVAG